MAPVKHRTWPWMVIAYLALVMALSLGFFQAAADRRELRKEVRERLAFDNKRAYDICVGANEGRRDINERFQRQTDFFASFGMKDDPKVKAFVARQKADELKPRDCEKELQVTRDG